MTNLCAGSEEARVEAGSGVARSGRRLPGRRERGQALVEFAIVLSVMFVVIVVGFAGFALYLGNYMALQHAVSVGARQAAVSSQLNAGNDPCANATTAANTIYQASSFEASTPTLKPTVSVYAPGLNGAIASVPEATNTTQTCAGWGSGAGAYLLPGATVQVTISHLTQSLFPYGSFTITAQAEAVVQGVPQ